MMITTNYTNLIEQAKAKGKSIVRFDQVSNRSSLGSEQSDTFTLSDKAKARMQGEHYEEYSPTYIKPRQASHLLKQNNIEDNKNEQQSRFSAMLQSILDKRLGLDREKLKEIEAMMKEVEQNENLSPEEKQKQLEILQKLKEQVIQESRENHQHLSPTLDDEHAK